MTSRIFAVIFGIIAGLAALAFLILDWDAVLSVASHGAAPLAGALAPTPARLAWGATLVASAFAIAALLGALAAGLAETLSTLSRIRALRHDPALAGRWNAADWRAMFAHTTVADRAETMIAATSPMNDGEERRVVVDAQLLLGLGRIWLDRLTLNWSLAPLPPILLAIGTTLALVAYAAGDAWAGALAAGFAGWAIVTVTRYAVAVILMPFVASAVAAVTAAIRPLTTIQALETAAARDGAKQAATVIDAQAIATALADAVEEPLSRLADAADRLGKAAAPAGTDSIDEAMAEIRAGIERLLAVAKG